MQTLNTTKKVLFSLALLTYTALLFKVLVFKDLPPLQIGHLTLQFGGTQGGAGNWIPLKTIVPYLLGSKGLLIGGLNIGGNILLLVPIGYLAAILFPKTPKIKQYLLGLGFCLLIETIQSIWQIGIFDIDDVILNFLGVLLGSWAFHWPPKLQIAITATGLLIAAGIFFQLYQLSKTPITRPIANQIRKNNTANTDLCGGTGGIGTIQKVEKTHFLIKRKDGTDLIVYLSESAELKTNMGPTTLAKLPIGKPVTLIGGPQANGSFLADVVLVCAEQ